MLFYFLFGMVVILNSHSSYSANILGFITDTGRSHCILHEALFKALATSGHNVNKFYLNMVTVVTACADKTSNKFPANYHELHLTHKNRYLDEFSEKLRSDISKSNELKHTNLVELVKWMRITSTSAHEALNDPVTKNLLESNQKIDLFILGYTFDDFLLGIAAHFKCPSIVMNTFGSTRFVRNFVASPPGLQNNPIIGKASIPITFFDRITFFLEHFVEFLLAEYTSYFLHQPYYEHHFPATRNYPSFSEIKRNVSLVLLCHHFSQGGIRPSVPNLIEIGGIHIKNDPLPLPKHIHRFLESAREHGAILFSLGSSLKSSRLDPRKLSTIMKAFAKLKQKVIWKWDGVEIPINRPDNVLMEEWLPQVDILAHPNVRLFISHCGFGGVTEALFYGVPILAIPFFADQHYNAKDIVEDGWAIHLPYHSITIETFSTAINNMLSNRTYADKVKKLSKIYRDRPQTALETAMYWTEYVLRHHGAPHMQSPLVHMNFFQRISLDVIVFLILFFLCSLKLVKWLFVFVVSSIFRPIKKKFKYN